MSQLPSPALSTATQTGNQLLSSSPAPQPSRLLRNLLAQATKFCDVEVPQLYPHPDLSALPSADLGVFIVSDVSEEGEAMMRQALELSVRLEIDTRYLGKTPGTLTRQDLNELLAKNTSSLADAKKQADVAVSLLAALTEVAAISFESLLINKPTDLLTTDIDLACLQVLTVAGVNAEACVNPGQLYQAIAIRFNEVEQLVMTKMHERLKLELHVQRLELVKVAGSFLSRQAARILDKEFLGNDDFQRGDHHTEIELTAVANNPFVEVWPRPDLDRDERRAETARLADLAKAKGAAQDA